MERRRKIHTRFYFDCESTPFHVYLCIWRWGGLGKGVSSFSSACILWAVFEGSCFSSSFEEAVSFFPSSSRLFVQFCLPEPAGGDFLDKYIKMQHKLTVKSVGLVSES